MKTFFILLFFSKVILLTPDPIILDGVVTFVPEKPLTAITTGASIQIDISSIIIKDKIEGIEEFRQRVKNKFPPHAIEAKLIQKNGDELLLSHTGGCLFNHESTRLSLYPESGVPTDMEFVKVVVKSKIKMEGVTIHWKNHKH